MAQKKAQIKAKNDQSPHSHDNHGLSPKAHKDHGHGHGHGSADHGRRNADHGHSHGNAPSQPSQPSVGDLTPLVRSPTKNSIQSDKDEDWNLLTKGPTCDHGHSHG